MRKNAWIGALLCAMAGSTSLAVVPSIEPLTTFGGGDGWLAPGDRTYLTTDNAQRGLAYNPVTGNLLLVNRSGGVSVNILSGVTGANVGTLPLASFITGAGASTFPINMIAAGDDGTIYAANLSIGTSQQLRIYQWENETSAPSMPFINDLSNGPRVGDSLDVRGSASNAQIILGTGGGSPTVSYVMLSTSGGAPYSVNTSAFASQPRPGDGEMRLGITFTTGNNILGTRGGMSNFTELQPARYSSFGPGGSTLLTSPYLTAPGERPMDFAEIDGLPVLATVDTETSVVRVYDFTDPSNPLLLDSHTNVTGPTTINAGIGQVRFGAIAGNSATLYALNTNNGIQAFTVTVPEPASISVIAAVLGAASVRRRRK